MTVNYQKNGADLATLLAPIHAGWPAASATLYLSSGADLNTIFAEAASGTAYGTTNFKHNGVDIGTLFAALGTTSVALTTISAISGSSAAGNPSGTVTSNSTTVTASKGKQSGYTYTWIIASGSATIIGQGTATASVDATVNAGATLSGTIYVQVSDGTTTTNSNTVAWSLQNTSSALPGTLVLGTTGFPVTDMQVIGANLYVVNGTTQIHYTANGTSWLNFIATQVNYGSAQGDAFAFLSTGTGSAISQSFGTFMQFFGNATLNSTTYNGATIAGTSGANGAGSGAVGGGVMVMQGYGSAFYATSTNGTTWTAHGAMPGGYIGTQIGNCLSYVNGHFVGAGTNQFTSSTNGTSWTTVTPSPASGQGSSKVAFGGTTYVAATEVSGVGRIYTSTNLTTWTQQTIPSVAIITAIVYTGTKFVFATNAGETYSSTTGASGTWVSKPTILTSNTISQMAVFGANTYIGIQTGGVYQVANTYW